MDGMRQFFGLAAACALALTAAACDKNTQPVPVLTPIASPTISESYSGTLFPFGSNLHSFEVKQSSEVHVTVTSITTVAVDANPTADPPVVAAPAAPFTQPLTITVGQPTLTTLGVQCSHLKSVEAPAGSSPQIKGQALTGTYCVSISDPNNILPRAVTYAITVAHS